VCVALALTCQPLVGSAQRLIDKGIAFPLMLPTSILAMWLKGLLALAILGGGIYALWEWFQQARQFDSALDR
jgi:hypothetical protein